MSENPQKYLNAKEAKAPIDTTSIKVDEDEVAEEGVSAKGEETKGEEDVLEEDGAAVKAKVRAQVKKEIDEMNADSEDETYEFQEDELEALLDEVEKETFTTEEEAIAFLEEKHKQISNVRIKANKKPKLILKSPNTPDDPYEEHLQTKEMVESQYENEWVLDKNSLNEYFKQMEDGIGRYPHGFRHYESYANY